MSEPSAGMMVSTNVRLLRPLGEGGMGSVWVADHLSLRTQVVVKFMMNDLLQSADAKARFSREAAAASQVKSPHVVQMFDHGVTPEGTPYIVMELLEGTDLDDHIRAVGRLAPVEVAAVVGQLARALGKAHDRGIIHRDIKPSNVFLCDSGGGELFVKLLDFGIAKGPEVGVAGSTTRTGSLVGSPYYMSPEQVVGAKNLDFRSDLWSLGVVGFEALTGTKPFQAETVGALALKIHRDPMPLLTAVDPSLPPALDEWFLKACAREPGERFASVREMADALSKAVAGEGGAAVNLDGVKAPRPAPGMERTAVAQPAATPRPVVDARSETGAGVGLPGLTVSPGRGKWAALAAVTVAAVGVGMLVPRLRSTPSGTTAGAAPLASETATVTAAASGPAQVTDPVKLPAIATSAPPAATSAPGVASPPAPVHVPPRPRAPAAASVVATPPSPPAPSSPPKPPHGSDDDIK